MPNANPHVATVSISAPVMSISWRQVAWIFALLPCLLVLLTWDSDGILTSSGYALRHYGWPITLAELFVIWLATRSGWQPIVAFKALPMTVKRLAIAWLVIACVTVAMNSAQLANIGFMTFRYFVHGVFFAALVFAVRDPRDPFKTSMAITAGAMLYIAVLSLFVLMTWRTPDFPWINRLPSATNVRQIGYYVAIMAVAPLTMILFAERRKIALYAICFAATLAFVAWSGSRAALIGISLGSVVALAIMAEKPTWTRMVIAFTSAILGLGASLMLPTPSPEYGLIRMVGASAASDVSTGRTYMWGVTIAEIKANPVIGHGAGSFRENMGKKYDLGVNQPHQFVLQYLYDWGIFGGMAALSLLALLFYRAISLARQNAATVGFPAISALLTTAAIAMIDGAFYSPLSIVLALVMLAPLIGRTHAKSVA